MSPTTTTSVTVTTTPKQYLLVAHRATTNERMRILEF